MDLKTFASKVQGATPFGGLILAFDPGETTGFCVMEDFKVQLAGQIDTSPNITMLQAYTNIEDVFDRFIPDDNEYEGQVAIEDYRVYEWKADSHSWSQVHTIKIVGLIQLITQQAQLKYTMRMAGTAKGFCTDEKLELWDLYKHTKGMKHSRDALRHACYHAIWPKKAE